MPPSVLSTESESPNPFAFARALALNDTPQIRAELFIGTSFRLHQPGTRRNETRSSFLGSLLDNHARRRSASVRAQIATLLRLHAVS